MASPPPMQTPWIIATTGFSTASKRLEGGRRDAFVGRGGGGVSALRRELRDVRARGEGLLARPAQHDDADRRIGRERPNYLGKRLPHLEADGIQPRGIAQHEPRDADRLPLHVDAEIAHATGHITRPGRFLLTPVCVLL